MPPAAHSLNLLAHMRRLRWSAFALVGLAYILSFFHRIAPAAIATELQQAFQTSGVALGALAATYFYVYTLMQIPTGVLVDTLGPRRIVTMGGIIAGIGAIMFGMAETLNAAMVGRTLVGLGTSVVFIALLKLNAAWFKEGEFATIVGLTVFMGNMGAVFSAAPLAALVAVVSWRSVFEVAGAVSLGLAVLTWLLVRDAPGAAGLPSMREIEGKISHPPHEGHWLEALRSVMKNRLLWPNGFAMLGIAGSFLAFAGLWAVPYLSQAQGMTRTYATYHTSLSLIGFAVGALVVGAWSDKMGRRKPLLLGLSGIYVCCWLPLLLAVKLPLGVTFALFGLMGFCASAFTLGWACAKEVTAPALSGMATSLVNTGAFLGAAILQPLVGWALDVSGKAQLISGVRVYADSDFQLGLSVLAAFALFGLVCMFFIKETHCRNITHD